MTELFYLANMFGTTNVFSNSLYEKFFICQVLCIYMFALSLMVFRRNKERLKIITTKGTVE